MIRRFSLIKENKMKCLTDKASDKQRVQNTLRLLAWKRPEQG
jgi:hypothetical protein